jgi:hypothetical protein
VKKRNKTIQVIRELPYTKCCFCTGQFSVIQSAGIDRFASIHTLPTCQQFMDMDMLSYLKAQVQKN